MHYLEADDGAIPNADVEAIRRVAAVTDTTVSSFIASAVADKLRTLRAAA